RTDLVEDAAFRLGRASTGPRSVRDVCSGYRAGGCKRHRRRDGARERRILFQAILVVAKPQLCLVASHERTELADIALRPAGPRGVNWPRRSDANRRARNGTAASTGPYPAARAEPVTDTTAPRCPRTRPALTR